MTLQQKSSRRVLQAFNFIKKRLQRRCLPGNIVIFLKTPFSQNSFSRLLLTRQIFIQWSQNLLSVRVLRTSGNYPAGNCMFEVNKWNTRTRCEIRSTLTIKTPDQRQWRRSGVFIVNFEQIAHLVLVFPLLPLGR